MAEDLRASTGFSSRLRSWGFYVCLGQMVAGLLMVFVATSLHEPFTQYSGVGIGILTILMAIVGLVGLKNQVDHMLTVHVIGVILVLSMLFPLRFQVVRNADVDCAIAEIALTTENLSLLAQQQNGRNTNLFNVMFMRMKAMSMTMDRIHSSHINGVFKSNTTNDTIEHTHYKQFWRVADEGFISEQLEVVRDSARDLMKNLKEKIAKKAKKVKGKYEKKNLQSDNVEALDEAVKIAIETATMAMRRTNEHLQNRLPEDTLTIVEFESLVNSLDAAMQNLKEILAAIENEIGSQGNPLKLKVLEKVGGGSEAGHLGGALENAVAIKEAMERQQTDIYDHLDLGDIQETKDSFQQAWNQHLLSKINKTALDEREYLERLPSKCFKESSQEEVVRMAGLGLIFLHLVSLYIMFSLDIRLAILSDVKS